MFSWLWGAASSATPPADDAVVQLQTSLRDASHSFRHGPMGLKSFTLPALSCYPPTHSSLSLLCLADCHGCFPDAACMPACDLLVVAGDFTLTGSEAEVHPPSEPTSTTRQPSAAPPPHTHTLLQILQFYAWLTVCKWRHCVLVPGFCELRAGATAQRLQVHRGSVF
jgi:hypothetical protein